LFTNTSILPNLSTVALTGIINALKLAGNQDAELVNFCQPRQTQPNPNATWGLVDKKELVDWMVVRVK